MQVATAVDIKVVHTGVFHSLMKEFEQHRLPRLLRLKDKVDSGEAINDIDFDFLCKELKDAGTTMHMTVCYPELQEFCLCMSHFYKEICEEALQNEKR